MASATAPTTLSLLKTAASSTSTAARASLLPVSTSGLRTTSLRGLGFSAADPLFSSHVVSKIRSLKSNGKAPRAVVSMAKKSVGDLTAADLKGKRVFVRADLNVPLDDNQNITDDTRIRAAIPTIKYLISNGAKVILSSHLGRPKGVTPKFSLAPLVPRLSELLGIKVVKADDCIGLEVEKLVASLPDGVVLLLENVRFYKEEEKNEPEFAKKLASLADLYVNDAFGTAHASTEGVTKFLKPSVAGFLLQKLQSKGSAWDEIDFEFLGNLSGDPYILHTNVYSQGKGDKEQQFYLWFDPTADFHTYSILWNPQRIIFYVDGSPIREFKNMESIGVPFPKYQPMRIYSTLWNADDWATRGGLVKTDWSQAPFTASYTSFNASNACVWINGASSCDTNNFSPPAWLSEDLDSTNLDKLQWVQTKNMIYNYCTDAKRFPQGFPPECNMSVTQ